MKKQTRSLKLQKKTVVHLKNTALKIKGGELPPRINPTAVQYTCMLCDNRNMH